MFNAFKNLISVGIIVFTISDSYAQNDDYQVAMYEAGRAYEYRGHMKYFSAPTKLIFGSKDLQGSAIVPGYRFGPSNAGGDCPSQDSIDEYTSQDLTNDLIVLGNVPVRWWVQPYYSVTDYIPTDEEFILLLISDDINNISDDINNILAERCLEEFGTEQFLVDHTIAQFIKSR